MIDFFDRLYSSVVDNNKFLRRIRFYRFLRFIIRLNANLLIPFYFIVSNIRKRYALEKCVKNEGRIIVTLTSFPLRIGRIWLVIESILRQSKKPDKIILWLSKDQFPSLDALPKRLLSQVSRGLEIVLKDGDIRSFKKYYYALKEFPNDNLITIDDDIFYQSNLIENLYDYSIRYPDTIVAKYCKKMIWDDSKLVSHIYWPIIKEELPPNFYSFFGTGGGVFIPPGSFDGEIINTSLFLHLTPTADDVWINALSRVKMTKVTVAINDTYYLPVINFKNVTLESVNNGLNQNDEQIKAVSEYFIKTRGIDPFPEIN